MAETRLAATRADPERQVADLLGVLDAGRRLATQNEIGPLLAMVEQAMRRLLDCEKATLYLHDPQNDELVSRAADDLDESRIPAGWGFLGDLFRCKGVASLADLPGHLGAIPEVHPMLPPGTRNVLACPVLASNDAAIGLLLATDARRERFDEWDEVLARAWTAQAGAAIERQRSGDADRLHIHERALEIDAARKIQRALLPRHAPSIEGYDIAGWYQPADETGGDFYDFQDCRDGRLAVAIGDVSGHGFGPALVVASCRAFFRATLIQTEEPARVVTQVNQLLCQDHLDDRFVTAFFGILRRDTHRLEYVSAGQGPILFFSHAGCTFDELTIQGFPLGLAPDLEFGPPASVVFAPGDFLALITDGFFEWFNPKGECFGVERMKSQIDRNRSLSAAEIIHQLHAAVLDFADGSPQPDDLTAMVIKRLA